MCRYSATLGSTVESSSYPRSTTAWRRARVTESPVANSVTSQPCATRPSVMLPATVSHAPYCRGGVRHATGERMAIRLEDFVIRLNEPRQSWSDGWGVAVERRTENTRTLVLGVAGFRGDVQSPSELRRSITVAAHI